MLSIPRDTMVTLLANQSLYGNYNRINVNYANGPSLLVQTITANFGIPINTSSR
jgi:anionic cell wall polymer biosynthesis LytR-Cps2A-Psr (LCP) family protein